MTRLLRLNARFWPALTFALLAAVTVASLIPRAELQAALPGGDKVQHLAAYAALALPAALARPRGWVWMLASFVAWSWGIELAQPLVNRTTHLADLAANVAGLALGTLAATGLRRLTGGAAAVAGRGP